MGYTIKDMAVIQDPQEISLSGLPNFVQFESKPSEKKYPAFTLEIKAKSSTVDKTLLRIITYTGEVHEFKGTTERQEVGGSIFFISDNPTDNADNLRRALLSDMWVRSHFNITPIFYYEGYQITSRGGLLLKAKGSGKEFSVKVETPYNGNNQGYVIRWEESSYGEKDSISGDEVSVEIELDIYVNPELFFGEDDRPTYQGALGTYLTTLSKNYAGKPLWFDLNALFRHYLGYNSPPISTKQDQWFDTGTATPYRFIARTRGVNSSPFYVSRALYVVKGWEDISGEFDLSDYVFSGTSLKLLTNKPRTKYVRGQREYLNFIFRDYQRNKLPEHEYQIGICTQFFDASGKLLNVSYGYYKDRVQFNVVNTCILEIESYIKDYLSDYPEDEIKYIKMYLCKDDIIVSNALEYEVFDECLHTLQQFTFLNRLGGWDNFNADASVVEEVNPESLTYHKTLTPEFRGGESVETVYDVTLNTLYSVESAPLTDEEALWLKEMASSKAIFDNDMNYVIIENFELERDPKNKNQHCAKFKYRLSHD